MSDPEWARKKLLRVGAALLTTFAIVYAISVTEIALSFTPKGYDGIILELYKILGYQWDRAGYNMMLAVTILLMVGGVMGYYGVKTVKRAQSLKEAC